MIELIQSAILLLACTVTSVADISACVENSANPPGQVAGIQVAYPEHTGASLDVAITAPSALVWDVATGQILYEKAADVRRPVASLSKLMTVLTIRHDLPLSTVVTIPPEVTKAQRLGANIKLPVGMHATVDDLLAASLIPSANDAAVALALANNESEEEFAEHVNAYLPTIGIRSTALANATGLSGGRQYSTAQDVMRALTLVYNDDAMRSYLSADVGTLQTIEGQTRSYKTTNKLLGTYLPILAAKTGYTIEAGENLAIITTDEKGHEIGIVVLGSQQRFQDTKILSEWIWRNFTWPAI